MYLSAQPAGTYSLRLEVVPEKPGQTYLVRVRVEQGVLRFVPWLLTLLGLSVIPVCVVLYQMFFEHLRWQESNVVGQTE